MKFDSVQFDSRNTAVSLAGWGRGSSSGWSSLDDLKIGPYSPLHLVTAFLCGCSWPSEWSLAAGCLRPEWWLNREEDDAFLVRSLESQVTPKEFSLQFSELHTLFTHPPSPHSWQTTSSMFIDSLGQGLSPIWYFHARHCLFVHSIKQACWTFWCYNVKLSTKFTHKGSIVK